MAFNEKLTERVRAALANVPKVEERRMFSGITFMVNGKMCISVGDNRIMCRIDPAIHNQVVKEKACQTVIMRDREYKGYVYVAEDRIAAKEDFEYWIKLALDFNEKAKASTRKRK